jgi:hypothetical protein
MRATELQPNTSNLQTLEAEATLTKQELKDFRKLPKEQQEKEKQDKLSKLSDLQNKLDQAIQEAIKTGNLEEAKKLKEQLEKEIKDVEEQIEITERTNTPEGAEYLTEITVGNKTKEELIRELEEKKVYISDYVKSLINNIDFAISDKQEHLDLVNISVKNILGFPKQASTNEIYYKAKELGLELCPVEVSLQLILQYNPSNNEYLTIATQPVIDPEYGHHRLLVVGQNDEHGKHINFTLGGSNKQWHHSSDFVFCIPHK